MLTQENEILRNKIKKLKQELNELLVNAKHEAEQINNNGYDKNS